MQYTVPEIVSAFAAIEKRWPSESGKQGVRFALWNAGSSTWGGLLSITAAQIQESVDVNVCVPSSFPPLECSAADLTWRAVSERSPSRRSP